MLDIQKMLMELHQPIESCINRCVVLYCYKDIVHGEEVTITRWSMPKYRKEAWRSFYRRNAELEQRTHMYAEARRRGLT